MVAAREEPATIAFATQAKFERWLEKNAELEGGIWLKLYKKDSGIASVTYAEAVQSALCWGWIDGQRKAFDDEAFLQRFTPRRPRSIWSQRNVEHVERLIAEGRMTPRGHREIETAKADGRWDKAYHGSARMEMPDDLLAALEAEPAAYELYLKLNAQNRYALSFRTHNMKTPAGRAKKIASLVDMLKRGETPYPNGKAK